MTNSIGFSMVAVAAGIVSGPLVESMQALAFPWFSFGGFHRGFGLHHFGFQLLIAGWQANII